jgi:hypothetical protein
LYRFEFPIGDDVRWLLTQCSARACLTPVRRDMPRRVPATVYSDVQSGDAVAVS